MLLLHLAASMHLKQSIQHRRCGSSMLMHPDWYASKVHFRSGAETVCFPNKLDANIHYVYLFARKHCVIIHTTHMSIRNAYACFQGHGAAVTGAMHPLSVQMLIRARPYQASTSATLVAHSASIHQLMLIDAAHPPFPYKNDKNGSAICQILPRYAKIDILLLFVVFSPAVLSIFLLIDAAMLPLFGSLCTLPWPSSQFEDLTENIIHSPSQSRKQNPPSPESLQDLIQLRFCGFRCKRQLRKKHSKTLVEQAQTTKNAFSWLKENWIGIHPIVISSRRKRAGPPRFGLQ